MLQIEIDVGDQWPKHHDWREIGRKSADAAIAVSPHIALASSSLNAEISIKLSDNDEVQQLNASYRGKDKPTNVLSFPLIRSEEFSSLSGRDEGELLLGDVILAHDICRDEAKDKKIAMGDHVSHLVVHGTLHLLGYDHEKDSDAQVMEDLEVKALAKMGLPNPYADHVLKG